ncbi:GNAT family N-acetyltransferase [Streptomyces sp. SCUT-3]|uniref:GNAT family N-acetyltransferase n=1 Tax=Streptomyces TaxID=1883 RepID=UPI0015F7A824|nr:GNAT family N-acetyltransferase [Streptomyces sp. SCUT-3]QMV23211.1 GNAT family N-acetyltransferase [Streptomyces sp. SCUT-3]
MEPVTLTTERLVLRPFAPADVDAVHGACQDAAVQRWTQVPSPYRREDAEYFVERVCPEGWQQDTRYNFGSFTRDGGRLVSSIGLVGLALMPGEQRTAEVGYWTAPGQRGRGYTAEALRAVARWAFTACGADRLEWYAEVGNEGSRAVARRAGFTMEGTLRSRVLHRGTRRDAWAGSLLPSDLGLPSRLPYLPADGGPDGAADGGPGAVPR